jgi:hypothetical protein
VDERRIGAYQGHKVRFFPLERDFGDHVERGKAGPVRSGQSSGYQDQNTLLVYHNQSDSFIEINFS